MISNLSIGENWLEYSNQALERKVSKALDDVSAKLDPDNHEVSHSQLTGEKDTISSSTSLNSEHLNFALELYLRAKDLNYSIFTNNNQSSTFDSFY